MAKRFEPGDVCIVDEALTKNRNESNYVYIKDVLPFNKYRCLPCNYCGEITTFETFFEYKILRIILCERRIYG